MEVLFAVWAVVVLLVLVTIQKTLSENVAWSRRIHDRSVEQLVFLLFRTPSPTEAERKEKIDRIIRGLSPSVGGPEDVAANLRAPESHDGHPMVLFAERIGRAAYKHAEDVTTSYGPFEELTEEKKERFRQVFWEHFSFMLNLHLPGKAWLVEGMGERTDG
jgi:hypothetical protein